MQRDVQVRDTAANRESGHALISADRVRGAPVFDRLGEKLGHIEDVMLQKSSGRVAYVIVACGGFLGAGEHRHPLPWSMMTFDVEKTGYVIPITGHQLEGAPALSPDDIDTDADAAWAEAIHAHHGLPGPFI
jgi:sporulation protein YlmC with PRC-barrel domain